VPELPPHFVFGSDAFDSSSLHLRRLTGRERISRLFEVVVEIHALADHQIIEDALTELMRKPAHVGREGEDPLLHGVVREIELVPGAPADPPLYRLTLVPRLWYATQTRRCRIFQDMTVPAIVTAVLAALGLTSEDHEWRLRATYGKRDYTVQYEETDFAFLSRLLEFEGIYYWFDHGSGKDRIIFADDNEAARKISEHEGVGYAHGTGSHGHAVTTFGRRLRHVPERVMLVDYNWRSPALSLAEAAPVAHGNSGLQVTGEEHYRDPAAGVRLARMRAEEIGAARCVFEGASNIATLRPGDVLGLEGHTIAILDQSYLVLEVGHELEQDFHGSGAGASENVAYSNRLVAIGALTPYRPERTTPRPRIDGCTYATIDGPDLGAAAPIDDQGRYKVVLPFDTSQAGTGRATRWIRMAQPLSGASYGMHFPLRVGAEVMLTYVHGDPDRPLIAGALPNALTPSPVVQKNATQSVIQTVSGIRMELEDNAR
jgi:type VI secretion system secreted protein VgrG